jgi:hypothetical protein
VTIWSAASEDDGLLALVAAVRRSPIIARSILTSSALLMAEWAAVRKSNHADAFVLAWIASHVRGAPRVPRVLN